MQKPHPPSLRDKLPLDCNTYLSALHLLGMHHFLKKNEICMLLQIDHPFSSLPTVGIMPATPQPDDISIPIRAKKNPNANGHGVDGDGLCLLYLVGSHDTIAALAFDQT